MGERGEKERERNIGSSEVSCLALAHPQLETWPAPQACVLKGNRTGDLSVPRLALNPLSHTHQGSTFNALLTSHQEWDETTVLP